MHNFLDFEKPVAELEAKIEDLRHLTDGGEMNIAEEVAKLQAKVDKILRQSYARLTPWQKVQVARHPDRPHFSDYAAALIQDFTPLAGDRTYGEDRAIIGGLGRFRGRSVMAMGHEKGKDAASRVMHNFGMARPEGYRKTVRLMELADRFNLPVITFVDTAGAYPGVGAEERGQSEAIARAIETCLSIRVPFVSTIVGEGGSGGAIAIAAANSVLMLEHAVYSVISPEGCASILWRDTARAQEAAEAMRVTAEDLFKLQVIDEIVPEPVGGAHRHPEQTIKAVGDAVEKALERLSRIDGGELAQRRREKFLEMGKAGLG
ncbi:MAG: acetyl-CoA carboxylase carboxyltransferase subunit alpha [Alphaproteobacteria bacterium]